MLRIFLRKLKKRLGLRAGSGAKYNDINPEDIFLDSTNLPGFEQYRLEGRIERPINPKIFFFAKVFILLIIFVLVSELWSLQIRQGSVYAEISENNRLEKTLVFANRGVIYDRKGRELAANIVKEEESDFAARSYTAFPGLAHVIGYVKYPLADKAGIYYEEHYRGRDGAERAFDEVLAGQNGLKLREIDARGKVTSESLIRKPVDGRPLMLSIDAEVTSALHRAIASIARERGFVGGAGVLLDVTTGEVLALTSFPEYDPAKITSGKDRGAINALISDPAKPFLNRSVGGLYPPGSIIKPLVALAALDQGLISPTKEILSTGSITVPNPYDPDRPSVYRDWKAHGWTDMREALAVSSDVYFYSIGGGFSDQKGLGIALIDQYFELFGLSEATGVELGGEVKGVVPTPEWKAERFDGDPWRLGDTYITAIGQYGTQVTPITAARFVASIANGGKLVLPSLAFGGRRESTRTINLKPEDWRVVREGMRASASYGTSVGLNVPYVRVAAKTGTSEVGTAKKYIHSWSVGFFPYEAPRYAFAVVMERGSATNAVGATAVVRFLLDWMNANTPEYLR